MSALQYTDATEFQMMRATIIDLIMATDMKNHFSLVSRLQVSQPYTLDP